MVIEVKVRRIGSSLGVIIPKERLDELGVEEGDTILIPRIGRPVRDIRGLLKGTGFTFHREAGERDVELNKSFKEQASKRRRQK